MSGFGAPARTPTPIPDRAMLVRVSAEIFPSLIHASKDEDELIKRSKGSPASMRRANPLLRSVEIVSLCPVARSNCGPISARTVAIALAVQTVISAAELVIGAKQRITAATPRKFNVGFIGKFSLLG